MAENITLARPYAKAVYQIAQETNQIAEWLDFLNQAAVICSEKNFNEFVLSNPKLSNTKKLDILLELMEKKVSSHQQNFLKELQYYKRLLILTEITKLFQQLILQEQKKTAIRIEAAFPLTTKQTEQLSQALKIRLQSDIVLETRINPQLIGGLVIYMKDSVLDYSVRGKLERLKLELTG